MHTRSLWCQYKLRLISILGSYNWVAQFNSTTERCYQGISWTVNGFDSPVKDCLSRALLFVKEVAICGRIRVIKSTLRTQKLFSAGAYDSKNTSIYLVLLLSEWSSIANVHLMYCSIKILEEFVVEFFVRRRRCGWSYNITWDRSPTIIIVCLLSQILYQSLDNWYIIITCILPNYQSLQLILIHQYFYSFST